MNFSSNSDNQAVIIAVIYFIGGIYSILTGILALAKMNIKIPGFYQLGVFISNLLFGKDRASNFEQEMMDRKKAIRYGIVWILIGIVTLAGGIFLLFVS